MHLDGMALAATLGFALSVVAAIALLYTIATGERGATVRLQRRLAPMADLPDLARKSDGITELVAHGLTPIARLARPLGEDELAAVRLRLAHAGLRSPSALPIYLGSKVLAALLVVALTLWASLVRVEPIRLLHVWIVVGASVGFFLPNLWLRGRVQARQKAIDRALPDALDLLVACVEAGLGLDAALQRVSGEVALAHPLLAEELTLTFLEAKAGFPRAEAFRRLAERTGVQDLRALAATLNQTELFGTSVATALRVQAEGMRIHRMQHAEERAATLAVKMTFPLVVCFLPTLMIVIVGPAFINIVEALASRRG